MARSEPLSPNSDDGMDEVIQVYKNAAVVIIPAISAVLLDLPLVDPQDLPEGITWASLLHSFELGVHNIIAEVAFERLSKLVILSAKHANMCSHQVMNKLYVDLLVNYSMSTRKVMRRKNITEDEVSYITWLENTLIPDLKTSGRNATAQDFEACVRIIKRLGGYSERS